ncbi:imidazole glycerol phosphate synthase subunit HisH [Massilia sp. ZL223]|uniref:imidazole glycerol phosphate synthase subunit HisH n=1 Tax=Massilia sp. ZL223 TaxID=2824904 RepID=UPI001B8284F1|nr:imidazole glycerol phosphate synthase subunit HisH [Massilia sp. ZL223]MBQ5963367.1 imidazole glycerol phosphate synthase subunit HisH [Massilia sp. ZL223]
MITIVDYGLGNIQAFADMYKRLHIEARPARTAQELESAKKIILPGVGAFDWAMARLNASGMRETLDRLVKEEQRPVLGVCVGMQMMADSSDEGELPGLGWIPARVKRFDDSRFTQKARLPHMGWNDALPRAGESLFHGMDDPRFYFLHSYYFVPDSQEHVLATTDYNGQYASAVRSGNVYGTQFHPEKSHHWGMQLLKNFAEI